MDNPKKINSLRFKLERANEDRNLKEYIIECMKKGIEVTHEISSQKIDALSSAQLKLIEENKSFRDQLVLKKNNVVDSFLSINDSSQKLPGLVNNDLKPFVYKLSLENKVMEFNKSFARKNVLEALQELLPQNGIVLRSVIPKETINQADTLPNQFVHSWPAYSEKYISSKGVAEQSGSTEVVLPAQVMPLVSAIPVIASSLMSLLISYTILTLLFLAIIWIVGRRIWNLWKKSNTDYSSNWNYFLSSLDISEVVLYDRRLEV